jgi:hypothetical protein
MMQHDTDEIKQFASKPIPLERLAEHGNVILWIIAVGFAAAAVFLTVSFVYKFSKPARVKNLGPAEAK